MAKIVKSEQEWRESLNPEQYRICRGKGTEPAFSGKYCDSKDTGTYLCAACGEPLFSSVTKYDSGSGWPSFYQPIAGDYIDEHADHSLGMQRVEVVCSRCDSHLGHVFPDGPPQTGLRYCINSTSLDFKESSE